MRDIEGVTTALVTDATRTTDMDGEAARIVATRSAAPGPSEATIVGENAASTRRHFEAAEVDVVVGAAKELLRTVRFERYTYLAIITLSLALLAACCIRLLLKGELGVGEAVTLWGSGGVIAASSSRLLRIWSDVWTVVADCVKSARRGGSDE